MPIRTPTSVRSPRSARSPRSPHAELAPTLLWAGLVDDAAAFPPGNAPLERAVDEHIAHRATWYSAIVGPLLVRAAAASELRALLDMTSYEGPLRVALVASAPADLAAAHAALAGDPRVQIVHVEAPLGAGSGTAAELEALLRATPVLDVVVEARWAEVGDVLREVARRAPQLRVKLRTGGTAAADFPKEERLAAALRAAVDLDISVKLTAGLHHALRHTDDATGREQHGFLNVIVAVRRALLGAEADEMTAVLSERDPAPLLEQVTRMSDADATVVRSFFTAFGCCGVTDPVRDLVALGLLEAAPAGPAR